jgi:hypothetical protein
MKTPRVVLDAFFPKTVTIGTVSLKHPFTVKHWLALEQIHSPVIAPEGPVKLLDLCRALYVCALAPAEVFESVTARIDVLDASALELAGRIPLPEASGILAAVLKHINQGFITAPSAGNPEGEDAETGLPFRRQRAARAGSSRSSPKVARTRRASTR